MSSELWKRFNTSIYTLDEAGGAKEHQIVTIKTSDETDGYTVELTDADTEVALGFLQKNTNHNAHAHLGLEGAFFPVADGEIAADDELAPSATVPGGVKAAESGDNVVGRAMTAAVDTQQFHAYFIPRPLQYTKS